MKPITIVIALAIMSLMPLSALYAAKHLLPPNTEHSLKCMVLLKYCMEMTPPKGRVTQVSGLSNSGVAVGTFRGPSGVIGTFLFVNGKAIPIKLDDSNEDADANSINDRKTIIGQIYHTGQAPRTYIWNSGIVDFVHGDAVEYLPAHINNASVAVGVAITPDGKYRAFVSHNGTARLLDPPGEEATWINESGTIAGDFTTSSGREQACEWRGGQRIDFGAADGASASESRCINDSGMIVGNTFTASGMSNAFVYRNGVLRNLRLPRGYDSAYAYAINNRGEIVGQLLKHGHHFAFEYVNGSWFRLIGSGGRDLQGARAINDSGTIVCIGHTGKKSYWYLVY